MEENKKKKKKFWSVSNIITIVLVLFIGAMLFSPAFKAKVMGGLMKIGLFQPKVSQDEPVQSGTASFDNLQFKDQKGNTISLADLKGKVIFINFWATWCPPCKAELPSINDLYNQYKDNPNMVFLMVDIDNKMEASSKYIQDNKMQLPISVAESPIPEALLGNAVPTTVVLDKTGAIAFRHEGMADYNSADFKGLIEKLLGK